MGTHTIRAGTIAADVEPEHGGRIGQITIGGTPILVGHSAEHALPISWGAYPMVPWAGRIRHGRFSFRGVRHDLPKNHGDHAMHGIGHVSTWDVVEARPDGIDLALALPTDHGWPFGGTVAQRFTVDASGVTMDMRVEAGEQAFPVSFGWHPWFRKPERLDARPSAMYRRDADGIAVDELVDVREGPWDDCFVIDHPIAMTIDSVELTLSSTCVLWVIYDEQRHATCVEPQTGPPDAFNIAPVVLEAGEAAEIGFRIGVTTW